MKPNWINFKELKTQLTFDKVFRFYGVGGLSMRGGQLVGRCPLPLHNSEKKDSTFSAHAEKGIFQCFRCGAKGNLLDFCVLMDQGNPQRGLDVRKTALKLQREFVRTPEFKDAPVQANGKPSEAPSPQAIVNEPLPVRLKDLEVDHPYLLRRGFARETMEHFGVGYCSRGLFSGRIAIPLHDHKGRLVGYAGRTIREEDPKYLFPGPRERDGERLEFRKTLFLYNGHRIAHPVDDLIVVEGFPSVWWLTQQGLRNCVGLMGSSFSQEQLDLILAAVQPNGRIWIMADGDAPGIKCGLNLTERLVRERLCRMVAETGAQPTDFTLEKLRNLLAGNRSLGAQTLELAAA